MANSIEMPTKNTNKKARKTTKKGTQISVWHGI